MLLMGIDPGTASTGYAVLRSAPEGDDLIEYGVLSTSPDLALPERLSSLFAQLQSLLESHAPQEVAVEALFFNRNSRTALAVGQARGVVLLACAQAGARLAEYTPPQVKQAVAGYGAADKGQVQRMLAALLGLPDLPRPDDAADAIAVALCHAATLRFRQAVRDAEGPAGGGG